MLRSHLTTLLQNLSLLDDVYMDREDGDIVKERVEQLFSPNSLSTKIRALLVQVDKILDEGDDKMWAGIK